MQLNQTQIINQKLDIIYELLERANQVQKNDSKSNNERIEKLFEGIFVDI
jgi:hypothetical protein